MNHINKEAALLSIMQAFEAHGVTEQDWLRALWDYIPGESECQNQARRHIVNAIGELDLEDETAPSFAARRANATAVKK